MSKTKPVIAIVLSVMMSLSAFSYVFGASYTKDVTASYQGIKIFLDMSPVIPRDANGNFAYPFIIDGTTYLPVRAVGEAWGQEVGWDPSTKTVYVAGDAHLYQQSGSTATGYTQSNLDDLEEILRINNQKPGEGDFASDLGTAFEILGRAMGGDSLSDAEKYGPTENRAITASYQNIKLRVNNQEITPTDVNGNIVEPFIVNGTTYLPVRAISEALDKRVLWDASTKSIHIGAVAQDYTGEPLPGTAADAPPPDPDGVTVGVMPQEQMDRMNALTYWQYLDWLKSRPIEDYNFSWYDKLEKPFMGTVNEILNKELIGTGAILYVMNDDLNNLPRNDLGYKARGIQPDAIYTLSDDINPATGEVRTASPQEVWCIAATNMHLEDYDYTGITIRTADGSWIPCPDLEILMPQLQ
jgi:hypothetical protein